ncbi:MAG: hypothetical protein A2513_03670 [Sulfurimonas sp. RIFOXYD12_FULL_33_39]|uniref:hypothetical protein n=1 Tax=unclassified Sulfurimonas TaxID=2623549 RepID=UPI0008B3986C|nr:MULTISPECIES: hypothetical protein [unclassified Sulfurimonas]OHE03539.1 MAG: hypothetical protein A3G74_04005 [Sulfurimonas sp. RIFCSPLOWO2_12_FULL_34_6]OHE09238.1 MAG: hypothetical protein A2513_03670 [Sulfurimonas sp. RIFOXYD12_FULL_33_39]OHE12979.1 MAG: hypothetical protein A2530_05135 [Sulfurimonas sp. RIFOXYD2_FULL_34_21]DAB27275.1 MAG TPA: hypothetical protein CFH78_08730 [Sulfurimonas sp. UBA10385]
MQNDFIELIKPIPKIHSNRCKTVSFLLKVFLQYTTVLAGLISLYLYDFFIALLTVVLAFIVMGIVRSKLRNSVIPFTQREYQYSDKAIADWYTAKELCYETTQSFNETP